MSLKPVVVARGMLGESVTEKLEVPGPGGIHIPARLVLPPGGDPHRCVLVLYGIAQDLEFFDKLAPFFAEKGFAMVMPEQNGCGERRREGIGWLGQAWDFWKRSRYLAEEAGCVVDYLGTRDDIDARQLDFMGASYGAIMGCSVLAREKRLRSGILVMAGGNFRKLLVSMARRHKADSRFFWPAAAELAAWCASAFDPLRHVGEIAPRPLLFLHVEDDELIERTCAHALVAAAGEPKEEIWYPDVHDAISLETIRRMMDDGLAWLRRVLP